MLYRKFTGFRASQDHLLNQEFIQALLVHFRQHGKKAIEKAAREQPAAYLKILAFLVPREMKIEHTDPVKGLSDEQLAAMVAELEQRIARRAGEGAKLIEENLQLETRPLALEARKAQAQTG